jgi:SAM-dependent methyltransferase
MSRWDDVARPRGAGYAARFAELAAAGADVHGEASFCQALLPPPARVLDAGCGTGRVAMRLTELGYDCVGVDADPEMLAEARRTAPDLAWVLADLATLDLPERGFDLVVAAGNVVPLVAEGSEAAAVAAMAAHLRDGGLLTAGFGLAPSHLPLDHAPVSLDQYDAFCAAAGLILEQRVATWDGQPYEGGPYAVSVHRRP